MKNLITEINFKIINYSDKQHNELGINEEEVLEIIEAENFLEKYKESISKDILDTFAFEGLAEVVDMNIKNYWED